ncbi:hypothetical protein U3A58_20010 [Algoriphagus sp. C2-6-M1]|uniref:hypothetical protein n=1 Tax=Algoriphagus persicinus TaxID=3108754 RepID=UPI002B3DD902|nr:hypothetical protein [Algoriphagus sp. C2-6-M1]MEB2782684.1 hypothetical protein [Algoriphagus sp. C2-6-M1]
MNKGDKIPIEELLYRRGFSTPEKKYCNPDGTATSRVFKLREKDEGMLSVDLKSRTDPERAIIDSSRFMLFEFKNESVEELDLETIYDPLGDGSNDAHSLVIGMQMDDDIAPGYLARNSKRVII